MRKNILLVFVGILVAVGGYECIEHALAQEPPGWDADLPRQHKSIWKVHDLKRPKPPVVTPGATTGTAPSDATVLFDGTDLSAWTFGRHPWKLQKGYMEVNNGGGATTKEAFGDSQLHLEYMAPASPHGVSQTRGNSGIILMGFYEVQVLDNNQNSTYSDGYIGAVYGQHPPLANASRKPGEWQTYDIVFRAPRFNGKKIIEPAYVTVYLNGVLVQHNAEIYGRVRWRGLASYEAHAAELPLVLQDHGDKQPVRFRNIWIRRLDLSPEALDNRKK